MKTSAVLSFVLFATATNPAGQIVYRETHAITEDSQGRPVKARTDYADVSGRKIAELENEFGAEIAAPSYVFRDLRDGSSHGVTLVDDGYLVWKKDETGSRREKVFKRDLFKGSLVTSGQGLFFYLRDHWKEVRDKGPLSVKLLIPGRLDYFSFHLSFEKQEAAVASFLLRLDSVFLRLFASSLRFDLDTASRRLLRYEGLSNITSDGAGVENVVIVYETDQAAASDAAKRSSK